MRSLRLLRRVVLVECLAKLHSYRFNLLTHFWIDCVLLLGKGRQSEGAPSSPTCLVSEKLVRLCFLQPRLAKEELFPC